MYDICMSRSMGIPILGSCFGNGTPKSSRLDQVSIGIIQDPEMEDMEVRLYHIFGHMFGHILRGHSLT